MTATTPQNPFKRKLDQQAQEVVVLQAIELLFELDPHAREELASHLEALNEAQSLGDEEAVAEVLESIKVLFDSCRGGYRPDDALTLEAWEEELAENDEESRNARVQANQASKAFLERYLTAKTAAELTTQAEVADRCDLSVNTVNAIETERVKPQYRTIVKLAKGLGVRPEWLASGEGNGPGN